MNENSIIDKYMMNVMLVLPYSKDDKAAAIKRVNQFAKGLKENGCKVIVLYLDPKKAVDEFKFQSNEEGFSEYSIGTMLPHRSSLLRSQFGSIIDGYILKKFYIKHKDELNLDCIHIYGMSFFLQMPLIRNISGNIVLTTDLVEWYAFKVKRLLSVHFYDELMFRKFVIQRLSFVVSISLEWHNYILGRGIKSLLIPAMSSKSENSPIISSLLEYKESFTLGYIGIFSKRDCPYEMLESIKLLIQNNIDIKFLVIGDILGRGDGFAKNVLKYIENDDVLNKRVEFTGWISDEERDRLMLEEIDAFVLIRKDDKHSRACFPTRLPEFLESGKPVLTTDVDSMHLYLTDGKDIVFVDHNDLQKSLYEKIRLLTLNRIRCNEIGQEGIKTCNRQFSYKTHMKRYMNFLFHYDKETNNKHE